MCAHSCNIDRCRSPSRIFVVADAPASVLALREAASLRRLDDRSHGDLRRFVRVPRPLQPRMDGSVPRDGKSLDRLAATATPSSALLRA